MVLKLPIVRLEKQELNHTYMPRAIQLISTLYILGRQLYMQKLISPLGSASSRRLHRVTASCCVTVSIHAINTKAVASSAGVY